MRHGVLLVGCLALVLAVWMSAPVWAAGPHQGKVVAIGTNTLTITDMAAKNQHTHVVGADAAITCDGQICGLIDVRLGDIVTVTTDTQDGKSVAIKIVARQAGS